jgi:GntR family transcriptional regulator
MSGLLTTRETARSASVLPALRARSGLSAKAKRRMKQKSIDCIATLIQLIGSTMIIKLDLHSGVPVYRQISDQLRFQITAGLLHSGEAIESVRNLAASLGVNSMTVSKAYALLEREGLLERRRGQQLTVAETEYTGQENREEVHLRDALVPAVRIARQLAISNRRALAVFRTLLEEDAKEHAYDEVRR